MDTAGEGAVEQNEANQHSDLNLSDVLRVLDADGSLEAQAQAQVQLAEPAMARPQRPEVRIVEQPAPKALRFRYECEGRSAGSILGVNSTPDRKTYPTIEILGYTGRAVVLVCCVTANETPPRSHPHNLVGTECRDGVLRIKHDVTPDNRTISFTKLGVQCVKRKEVVDALNQRKRDKIDPFRAGFEHLKSPQSINLNAVRLCFQVLMPDEKGLFRHSIVVASDVVYDKKAMSELHIARVSACTGSAKGGLQMIMLCDKVSRDEISVVFEERVGERTLWRANAAVDHVHKQYAIVFTVPAYHTPAISAEVETYLFLERQSDRACSNMIKFTYLPDVTYSGTARKPRPDLSFLSLLLADPNNNKRIPLESDPGPSPTPAPEPVSSTSESVSPSEDSGSATLAPPNGDVDALDEPSDVPMETEDAPERSLDDLLEQVAELDEIYSESRTRCETAAPPAADGDDDFDDAGTYTSLQLAFKNPVPIAEPDPEPYEDVQVHTYRGPVVEFAPLKRDDDEPAPPLPPKRVRRPDGFKTSQTSVDGVLRPGRRLPVTRSPEALAPGPLLPARSEPALPPAPKKRSFLSRLFRRKEKSPAPSVQSEGGGRARPVGRSVSSVSGQRPARFAAASHGSLRAADSVTRISLHGDGEERAASQRSLAPPPPADGTILVAESVLALDADSFRRLRDDLDLTEAEHYALYMAVAPHATASEFDDASCYYSPVDGGRFPADA